MDGLARTHNIKLPSMPPSKFVLKKSAMQGGTAAIPERLAQWI